MTTFPGFNRISDHVATLSIATDEQPYLGAHTITALRMAVAAVSDDAEVRTVILEGGSKHFSAGASRDSLTADGAGANITSYVAEIPRLITSIPVPVIAAMTGHAVGGGFILGLLCDAVVLAEESLYGANFMQLGFTPGMSSTYVVEEACGPHFGRELLYSGRMVKGRELQFGTPLSPCIVPRAQVLWRATTIAEEFAQAPRRSLELLKRRLVTKRAVAMEEALKAERAMHAELFASDETRERIVASYAGDVS
jgi:polyketide biosynthesis enoyl-CoA hydratase PksI